MPASARFRPVGVRFRRVKRERYMGFFSKLLSVGSDKELKRYQKIVERINSLEPTYEAMDD